MTVGVFGSYDGGVPEDAGRMRADGHGPARGGAAARGVRERWRMSTEARLLTVVTGVLVLLGLVVLYSASAYTAMNEGRAPHHYAVRQAQGALVGIVAFAVAAKIDAERWRDWAWWCMGLSLFLMMITVLPFTEGIFTELGGSRRFLIGGSIQPAEFAKLAVILWTPMLLVKKGGNLRRLGKGLGPFLVVIGLLSFFAIMQPDLSMAMTFCLLMAIILFAGGARTAHFVFLGLLAMPLLWQQASKNKYVRARVVSFFAGEQEQTQKRDAPAVADQQRQSLIAVGSGQLLGVGFAEGRQQAGWVPLAYNDFVASVVGEEFGFVGMSVLILAFAVYAWLGFRIAREARTPFQGLVAIGLTYVTVITAFVHIGVTIGILPNTGLTLPFVSYGRSNLVLTLLMTGILVNIGSVRERKYGVSATDPFAASGT
jgi:cell division protein FtsW